MIVAAENDNTVLVNFCIHKGANNFNEAMVGGWHVEATWT